MIEPILIRNSARVLGVENEIGSLEIGKRADTIIVDLELLSLAPRADIIYAANTSNVRDYSRRNHQTLDEGETIAEANLESEELLARVR